jgi:hypothetical protein
MLSSAEKLMAIEEIKQLKARYFRFIDSHDWPGFRSCITDDILFGPSAPDPEAEKRWKAKAGPQGLWTTPRLEGADALVAWVSEALEPSTSMHRGFNSEIEIMTADTARGIWGMEDITRFAGLELHGYGYYRESYVRQNGVWRIKTLELLRKSVELRSLQATAEKII